MSRRGTGPLEGSVDDTTTLLRHIEHATHLLPSQGPLTVFVHHNTLHAFEEHPFETGVLLGGDLYGCRPYLDESRYRAALEDGRIRDEDVERVLREDLGDRASDSVAGLASRLEIRRACLRAGVDIGSGNELRWLVAERAASLEVLWADCQTQSTRFAEAHPEPPPARPVRHRDVLLEATGEDTDQLVHATLIPFCGAFLDQGVAQWPLPHRDAGFLQSFIQNHKSAFLGVPAWRRLLPELLEPLDGRPGAALPSIAASLRALGVEPGDWEPFVLQTLLALRGWAGMIWQIETNADWLEYPAPPGTLVEFLCVRLLLERLAIEHVARSHFGAALSLNEVRRRKPAATPDNRVDRLAYSAFKLAQHLGWPSKALSQLESAGWDAFLGEIEAFSGVERRRVLHLAYERSYLDAALGAIEAHARRTEPTSADGEIPSFQIACCIDEREESFRRAIEELDPTCETLGIAGFFGVAMYYRGVSEAHFRPLCPVAVTPEHSVIEAPAYSFAASSRLRRRRQRRVGHFVHRLNLETRTLWGGMVTGLAGALAAIPLVARILFPRSTAALRRTFGRLGEPPLTELRLEREDRPVPSAPRPIGYSTEEMADIVEGGLRSMGLVPERGLSPVVVICGHGSSSLNNPQEAAHDCGACGGGRGGPNARAFAQMANDPRVRRILAGRGLSLDDTVSFIGAYHNTCDDSVTWYDLDRVPRKHRRAFEHARDVIDAARRRNAHERCRRFESAALSIDESAALRHVQARAEDLSETRPEYGHATNVLCLVGRRQWSRGLFLDRRAFLVSYDPSLDDQTGTILERLLRAVVPVCAGINLEYYFSLVDPAGYGCGTKLPHNITCLLGVMDGAQSDLRPGLPWQMVEIHEPVRLQFVVETTPKVLERILEANPDVARLVRGRWVHLAILDPVDRSIRRYDGGALVPLAPAEPPREVPTSEAWYRGHREHLGFASIEPTRS